MQYKINLTQKIYVFIRKKKSGQITIECSLWEKSNVVDVLKSQVSLPELSLFTYLADIELIPKSPTPV